MYIMIENGQNTSLKSTYFFLFSLFLFSFFFSVFFFFLLFRILCFCRRVIVPVLTLANPVPIKCQTYRSCPGNVICGNKSTCVVESDSKTTAATAKIRPKASTVTFWRPLFRITLLQQKGIFKVQTDCNGRAHGRLYQPLGDAVSKGRRCGGYLAGRPVSCKPLDSFFTPSDWTRHDCKMVNSCRRARYSG